MQTALPTPICIDHELRSPLFYEQPIDGVMIRNVAPSSAFSAGPIIVRRIWNPQYFGSLKGDLSPPWHDRRPPSMQSGGLLLHLCPVTFCREP
jgi:hypothetical protein